jgi:hypothetical protein
MSHAHNFKRIIGDLKMSNIATHWQQSFPVATAAQKAATPNVPVTPATAPVATPPQPVPPNATTTPPPLPVAVQALDKGLRSFVRSATTLVDYNRKNPDDIETTIERLGTIYGQLGELKSNASAFAENGKKLDGVVEDSEKTADWFHSQLASRESNQPTTINNSFGEVFNGFNGLAESCTRTD